jgi:hypothetical protein
MDWKNLFTVSLTKPELEEDERKAYERKQTFQSNLEKAYSRLETIEICNSNSKYEDASVLSQYLLLDILNLLAEFYEIPKVSAANEATRIVGNIPIENLQTELQNLLNLNMESAEEEESIKREESFVKVLYATEKGIHKNHKKELSNRLDDYSFRIKFQAIIVSILLIFGAYKGITTYLKNKPLNPGTAILEIVSKKQNEPETQKKEIPVQPSLEWIKIEHELETESPIERASIVPIQESSARIQIRNLRLIGKDGKVLFEAPLIITESFFKDIIGFIESHNLKPGRYETGRAIEFESINANPTIIFKWPKPILAKKIEWEMRMIKNSKKFND